MIIIVLVVILTVIECANQGKLENKQIYSQIVQTGSNGPKTLYSRTDQQYLMNHESIDKVDKYVIQAKRLVCESAKKVIILLQSYSGAYKSSGTTDSIYDYVTEKIEGRIDEISSDEKSTYLTLISLIEKLRTCDDNDEINTWLDTASRAFDNAFQKEVVKEIRYTFSPAVSDEQIEAITKKNKALADRIKSFSFMAFRKLQTAEAQKVISIIAGLNSSKSFSGKPGDELYEYFKQRLSMKLYTAIGKDAKTAYETAIQILDKLNDGEDDSSILNWVCDVYQDSGKKQEGKVYVPHWEHSYIYSKDELKDATTAQKRFYAQFKEAFLAGQWIDIEDNTNYAFILMFDLGDMYDSKEDHQKLSEQLEFLSVHCPKTRIYAREVLKKFDERILKKEAKDMLDRIGDSSSSAKWVADGEEVIVSGMRLRRGNFYLGDSLVATRKNVKTRSWSSHSKTRERFFGPVVNPNLEAKYVENSPMCSFSSYASMSKGQKYNYLSFLSGDVSFAAVHSSYLNLYLVGIEYRLFIDKQTTKSEKELLVKKLVEIYNSRRYANYGEDGYGSREYIINLLDRIVSTLRPNNPKELLGDFRIVALPRYSKIILKEFRGDTKKLSKEKAFEFAEEYFNIMRDIPAGESNYNAVKKRFFEIFGDRSAYQSNWYYSTDTNDIESTEYLADGIYDEYLHCDADDVCYRIKYPYSNADDDISYAIQNASNRIYWDNNKRRELIEDNRGKVTAYADMNYAPYIDPSTEPTLVELAKKIDSFADSLGFTNISVKQLVEWIAYPPRKENGIYKPYAEAITNALFKMGYGIAPNPNIERDRLMHDGYCCLYKLENEKGFAKNVYKGQIIVKMATQIALSDKVIENDGKLLSEGLKSFGFTGNTYLYLFAYAKQFSLGNQKSYIVKTLEDFTKDEIHAIYNLLLRMTFNSGDVSSERVKTLKRYCKALGQDPEKIHSGIHAAMTGDEFAIVEKTTGAVRYSIPKPGDVKRKFAIDTDKLERIQQQTNEAQELLSGIFVDDKPEEKPSDEKQPDVVKSILQKLFEKPVWEFSEVDELCKESGQMTGFVLEKINDYSYEKVDDAVVEQDGDQIYVTVDYKEQLI